MIDSSLSFTPVSQSTSSALAPRSLSTVAAPKSKSPGVHSGSESDRPHSRKRSSRPAHHVTGPHLVGSRFQQVSKPIVTGMFLSPSMLEIDNSQSTTAVPQSTSTAVAPHSLSKTAVSKSKSLSPSSGPQHDRPHSRKRTSALDSHVAESQPSWSCSLQPFKLCRLHAFLLFLETLHSLLQYKDSPELVHSTVAFLVSLFVLIYIICVCVDAPHGEL